MDLEKVISIKAITILTVLCFLLMLIIEKNNVSKYYAVGFIVILFLAISQYKESIALEEQMKLASSQIYFWSTVLLWNLIYVLNISFNFGRYIIKVFKG